MSRFSRNNLCWLAAYLASLGAVVSLLVQTRASRLQAWGRPETQARWREFQAGERKQWDDQTGPVRRRPAQAGAPADVILLRDHFGAVVAGIVATGTFLFAFVAILLRGSVAKRDAASVQ
ncbi:MAG TPA: hypothetical protein VMV69_18670 [Pirellulales bacterium]|nr:hypothetical protein [Pirellulales bacterium]